MPSHPGQANQRHRQADPRQTYSMNDSNYNQNQPRRKDQKLSAESGGTEFNQYQSTTNQQEDFKSTGASQNYQYDVNMQGSITSSTQRTPSKTNIPHLNIGQRTGSPDVNQRNYGNLGANIGTNYDEDVLLGENEVNTPRRQEQLENESKKTSGASTPSRDGADTPTRKNFNDHQQQLEENKGFIHDLTTSNMNRKYPIKGMRGNTQNIANGTNIFHRIFI